MPSEWISFSLPLSLSIAIHPITFGKLPRQHSIFALS